MLGSNEYENEEGAIDHIKKHIEEKRRMKIEEKRRKNGIEFLENFVEN